MCPRIARLRDEGCEYLDTPEESIQRLRTFGIRADLFTFLQRIPDRTPRHPFHLEWCSTAVLPLRTYEDWWSNKINDKTRNMVRKAARSRVEVKRVEFNDDLVQRILDIYNETPLRQGKPLEHYGMNFDAIKGMLITFLESSEFLGAFCGGELIGFAKLVHGDKVSSLIHILCKVAHRHRSPSNALIAGAVEACTRRNVLYLEYGEWSRRGLGEFKKHHAFEKFDVPRYFVPLNATGRLLLSLDLHRPWKERIPGKWQDTFVAWRTRWYTGKHEHRSD